LQRVIVVDANRTGDGYLSLSPFLSRFWESVLGLIMVEVSAEERLLVTLKLIFKLSDPGTALLLGLYSIVLKLGDYVLLLLDGAGSISLHVCFIIST